MQYSNQQPRFRSTTHFQQLSLFDFVDPALPTQHHFAKICSPIAFLSANIATPIGMAQEHYTQNPMEHNTDLLDLTEESSNLAPPPASYESPARKSHELPDHNPRTHSVPSGIPRKASGQQVFAFDDDELRDGTEGESSGNLGPTSQAVADNVRAATQERSLRNRYRSAPAKSREPTIAPSLFTDRESNTYTDRLKAAVARKRQTLFEYVDQAELLRAPEVLKPASLEAISEATAKPVANPSAGAKAKAHDILNAIRILGQLQQDNRTATLSEREQLAKFGGFGPVALTLFPDPTTGKYKDESWKVLGEELRSLLTDEDYESAKRTTFNAFYTSPQVIRSMHHALDRLGVPQGGLILEPGCGIGNFLNQAAADKRFIGVELDRTSGVSHRHSIPSMIFGSRIFVIRSSQMASSMR